MLLMALGKILLLLGMVTALVGAILLWAPGLLGWFGHLPGDIRIERDNGSFYFPITSMLVVSIVLSLLVNLFFRR
jgi:1-acyl-sn-glycerol-3-phosphate acyltransferase